MSIAIAEPSAREVVATGPRIRAVLALTRVEGRRLILHPVMLVAPGLIAVMGARPGWFRFLFLAGLGYFAIGIGTFVAANLCASRSRREKTEELYASLPLPTQDRTVAHLLSVAAPLTLAVLIAGVLAAVTRPWAGASVRLDIEPRLIMHGLLDFAQGPMLVAFLGVAGVALARWFSTAIGFPVAIALFVAINSIAGLSSGPLHWLNPVSAYSSTALEPGSVMAWHLMYLTGLILLLGLAALARPPRASGLGIYGAVTIALIAVGGLMQVLAASP